MIWWILGLVIITTVALIKTAPNWKSKLKRTAILPNPPTPAPARPTTPAVPGWWKKNRQFIIITAVLLALSVPAWLNFYPETTRWPVEFMLKVFTTILVLIAVLSIWTLKAGTGLAGLFLILLLVVSFWADGKVEPVVLKVEKPVPPKISELTFHVSRAVSYEWVPCDQAIVDCRVLPKGTTIRCVTEDGVEFILGGPYDPTLPQVDGKIVDRWTLQSKDGATTLKLFVEENPRGL